METGVIGVPGPLVASPVETGLKLEPESATNQHPLMEELIAQDQILKVRLAIMVIA